MVPVTTMEEIPVLSDSEKAELIAALEDAQARINQGHAVEFNPKSLKERLVRLYKGPKP